ncbi:MAG: hypothetical protein KY468_04090 [Armatimonadetes bacterium]|nr:hypothetical protein [Armatimonadota bacterium]
MARPCVPRFAPQLLFAIVLLASWLLPASAQAQLTLKITSPTPGQVITNGFGHVTVSAQLQTTYAIKTYKIQLHTLVREYQYFAPNVTFEDLASGEYTATARVEDQRGNVATDSVTFTLIRPFIEISAPRPGELARSELRVTARCQGCDYIETEIDPGHRTPFYARCDSSTPSCVEAPGTLKLDVVRPISHLPLGSYQVVVIAGTSSRRFWKTVPFHVVPEKGFRQLEKVPGTYIMDVQPDRLTYQTEGIPGGAKGNTLRLRDRRTGEDVAINPNDANGTSHAYVTPRGAIYLSYSPNFTNSTVLEWRDGQLLEIGKFNQLNVRGNYAVLSNLNGNEVRLRHLVTGEEVAIFQKPEGIHSAAVTDIGPNGEVLLKIYRGDSSIGPYDLLLWRSGSLSQIARTNVGNARTDGENIVYFESVYGSDGPLYLHTSGGNVRLATVADDFRESPILLNAGWIAYQSKDPSGKTQVWVRSPGGETKMVSLFKEGGVLKALGPNGEVIFGRPVSREYTPYRDYRLYLTDFSAKWERDLGFNVGQFFWQTGGWHLKVGNSLFAVTGTFRGLGDVDGSGAVEVTDATLTLRSIVGLTPLAPVQATAADVDKNGSVEVTDAILILRVVVGLDPPFTA